jgi:hypothetical protein
MCEVCVDGALKSRNIGQRWKQHTPTQHLTIKSEYLQFEQMGLLLTPAWSVRRDERQE